MAMAKSKDRDRLPLYRVREVFEIALRGDLVLHLNDGNARVSSLILRSCSPTLTVRLMTSNNSTGHLYYPYALSNDNPGFSKTKFVLD